MPRYQLTSNPEVVIRLEPDWAVIPRGHRWWDEYEAWLREGHTPEPAAPDDPVPQLPDPSKPDKPQPEPEPEPEPDPPRPPLPPPGKPRRPGEPLPPFDPPGVT